MKKKITNKSEQITFIIEEDWVKILKQEARKKSLNEEKDINYLDLIREAIEKKLEDFSDTNKK